MSVFSNLDLLYRDGAVSQNDFIDRGIEPEQAKAFADLVADSRATSFVQRVFGDTTLARDIEAFASETRDAATILASHGRTARDILADENRAQVRPIEDDDGFYTVYQTERSQPRHSGCTN